MKKRNWLPEPGQRGLHSLTIARIHSLSPMLYRLPFIQSSVYCLSARSGIIPRQPSLLNQHATPAPG
jgi:hypothetical protein